MMHTTEPLSPVSGWKGPAITRYRLPQQPDIGTAAALWERSFTGSVSSLEVPFNPRKS